MQQDCPTDFLGIQRDRATGDRDSHRVIGHPDACGLRACGACAFRAGLRYPSRSPTQGTGYGRTVGPLAGRAAGDAITTTAGPAAPGGFARQPLPCPCRANPETSWPPVSDCEPVDAAW